MEGTKWAGVIASSEPGLTAVDDRMECVTCCSRHCSDVCHATIGTVWVDGYGYRSIEFARSLPKGQKWHRQGWLSPSDRNVRVA